MEEFALLISLLVLIPTPIAQAIRTKNWWLNHRPLHEQAIFWAAINWSVALALVLGFNVWTEYQLQLDSTGYANFLTISRLPIGILGGGLALTAFITSLHRSIQTAKQIEEAENKNKSDLYYAHLKFFIEQCKDNRLISSPIKLHKSLYPKLTNKTYDLHQDRETLNNINEMSKKMEKTVKELRTKNLSFLSALHKLSDTPTIESLTTAHIKTKILEISKLASQQAIEEISYNEIKILSTELDSLHDLVNM